MFRVIIMVPSNMTNKQISILDKIRSHGQILLSYVPAASTTHYS